MSGSNDSNDRKALLARWAELAPGECHIATQFDFFACFVEAGHRRLIDLRLRACPDLLLSALIDAIRGRGWHYELFSDETEESDEQPCAWHGARVLMVPVSHVGRRGGNERKEPCDALLQAYVSAITAAKESSNDTK